MAVRNDAYYTDAGLVDVVDDWTETCDDCGGESVTAERYSNGVTLRRFTCSCIEDQLEESPDDDGPDPDEARDRELDREYGW